MLYSFSTLLLYIHFGKSLWFTWIPCNEASACRVSIIKQTNKQIAASPVNCTEGESVRWTTDTGVEGVAGQLFKLLQIREVQWNDCCSHMAIQEQSCRPKESPEAAKLSLFHFQLGAGFVIETWPRPCKNGWPANLHRRCSFFLSVSLLFLFLFSFLQCFWPCPFFFLQGPMLSWKVIIWIVLLNLHGATRSTRSCNKRASLSAWLSFFLQHVGQHRSKKWSWWRN